jgi:ubiquitin carboxyl-terminal hydrolase L3
MTHLVHQLGVSPKLGFCDVYSIDDPDVLAFVPRPAYALILVCPDEVYRAAREMENAGLSEYDGSGDGEPVIWFRQTIRNACGLMALLHGVSNGGAKAYIQPESALDGLLKEAIPLKPGPRARLIYESHALETAHRSAAQKGDTKASSPLEQKSFHYVTFVKGDDGHLWELNGSMKGPVDRGTLGPDEDTLSDRALQLGVRTFIDKRAQAGEGGFGFSIIALAPNPY